MEKKIRLSNEQIEGLIDFITPNKGIPEVIAKDIYEKNRQKFIKQLEKVEIYESLIPHLKEELRKQYYSSIIQAGESVGIITAQSIGERQTQQTLNSVIYEEEIMLQDSKGANVFQIGAFIDSLMDNNPKVEFHEGDQQYLDIEKYALKVPSVNEDGLTSWERVLAVTRHPGKIITVKTKTGRDVTASLGKSFLVLKDDKLVQVNGSDLKIGDRIPLTLRFPDFEKTEQKISFYDLDDLFAVLFALFLNNGKIVQNEIQLYNCHSYTKMLELFCRKYCILFTYENGFTIHSPDLARILSDHKFIYNANDSFISSVLNVFEMLDISPNKKLFNIISFMTSRFGFQCKIEDGKIVALRCKSREIFGNVYMDEVISIQEKEMTHPYLYDLTVENTKNFILFSGIGMADTFHSTGLAIKTVITGVPRFSELLNATQDPKAVSCNVYFNEQTDSIQNLRKYIGKTLKQLNFSDFVQTTEVFQEQLYEDWYDMFEIMKGNKYSEYEWGIKCIIKKDVLYEYNLSLYEIAEKIEDIYSDIVCVYSPDSIGEIHIYFDTSEITNEDEIYETDDEAKRVYLEEIILPTLNKLKLFGIEGVKDIFYDKKGSEWMIETEGSNLKKILGLPIVNKKKTLSNNMWDIYECFGIEATRKFLINEFKSVISSDGTFVNDCHATLLVDVMTYSGTIISVSRYGMKKQGNGPMAKASFEESLDNFLKAGIYGEKETTDGVSASIMLGKLGKFGTGICDIKMDLDKLKNRKPLGERVFEKDY